LNLHKNGYFGGKSYTSRVTDWELFLQISCDSIAQAVYVEMRIKKMKSRRYAENLKKYPELSEKIKACYKK